jgi:cytochrome P450
VLWELARQPATLSKLRAEIEKILGDAETPTYEQLKDMKFLKAILNESQRLYPIVPSNSREAIVDTFLPHSSDPLRPLLVLKGTYVAYHVYALHRRTDIYGEDADVFRPERWLEPGFRPGWAFMAFSGGPRVCIGQNFAITEAMYVVVRLVRGLEIETRDEEVWREKLSVTCTGAGGCRVGLRRREN